MKNNSDYLVRWSRKGWFRSLAKTLGLPTAVDLARVETSVSAQDFAGRRFATGGGAIAAGLAETLRGQGAQAADDRLDLLIYDASAFRRVEELSQLQADLKPRMGQMARHGRVLLLGLRPEDCEGPEHAAVQGALTGLTRSLAKELGRKAVYAHLFQLPAGGCEGLGPVLHFFGSRHSAFVTGRVVELTASPKADLVGSLRGKRVLVTGAGRGIGAATAERLAREGAELLLLDRPEDLALTQGVADRVGGEVIGLDISTPEAPAQLAQAVGDRLDAVVHNAGITRDKTLGRMSEDQWNLCLQVNLAAVLRLNEALLAGPMKDGGHMVLLSSISGLSGNVGQTNYAAAKSGLVALAKQLSANGALRCNAVAPGFIETRMTAGLPFTIREGGRRMAALKQGGLPDDVAALITFLASPASAAVSGQTIRVCGFNMMGA